MSESIRIAGYDENQLLTRFAEQHARLAQLDLERRDRSITARNYNSSILALGDFLARQPEGARDLSRAAPGARRASTSSSWPSAASSAACARAAGRVHL